MAMASVDSTQGSAGSGESRSTLSVVIPIFNEEAVLPELARRLNAVLPTLGVDWDVVFVDDGSSDRSLEIISQMARQDAHFSVISLSRNFGHQIAITAGLDHVDSDAVVIMDADLQDPPEVIAQMLAKWREGFEMVYGKRISRAGESWFKKGTAAAFYRILLKLSDFGIPVEAGDFRLLDRNVVSAIRQVRELHRFMRGLVSWVGFRQTPVLYERQSRAAGQTKYSFVKMLLFALDAITSFSVQPLRTASFVGLAIACSGAVGILWMLYLKLYTDKVVPGLASVFCLILFLGGTQLVFLGIIGEYLGRVYQESKNRPLYFVRETVGTARRAGVLSRTGR